MKIELRYVNSGKCMECNWETKVYHYTMGDLKKVWRKGCKCSDRGNPTQKVRVSLEEQEQERVGF